MYMISVKLSCCIRVHDFCKIKLLYMCTCMCTNIFKFHFATTTQLLCNSHFTNHEWAHCKSYMGNFTKLTNWKNSLAKILVQLVRYVFWKSGRNLEFGICRLQVGGWRLEGRLLHNSNNFLSILYAFIHLKFLFLKSVTLDRTTSV